MKMVAAAKLRKAQEQATVLRPYAHQMQHALHELAAHLPNAATEEQKLPLLLTGYAEPKIHLLVVISSDRGLCGGFNNGIIRRTRLLVQLLMAQNKTVKIICIGRKGYDLLKRDYGQFIIDHIVGIASPQVSFEKARAMSERLTAMYEQGQAHVVTLVYNHFINTMRSEMTEQQLLPMQLPTDADELLDTAEEKMMAQMQTDIESLPAVKEYSFYPSPADVLDYILPRNAAIQLYHALLESLASEHGARMTAMDSATRNAGEMVKKLRLRYNRQRQEYITKELIDIISGAESV